MGRNANMEDVLQVPIRAVMLTADRVAALGDMLVAASNWVRIK